MYVCKLESSIILIAFLHLQFVPNVFRCLFSTFKILPFLLFIFALAHNEKFKTSAKVSEAIKFY